MLATTAAAAEAGVHPFITATHASAPVTLLHDGCSDECIAALQQRHVERKLKRQEAPLPVVSGS
jgi:uncharacterized metal-binding protein